MGADIITETFESSQVAVAARIDEILDACQAKDFDRLASYHLAGPKFTKFDDEGPQVRQDSTTAMQAEIDAFRPLEDFTGWFEDLKIDVFGDVAVATGIFRCAFRVAGKPGTASSRTSAVFVDNNGQWLIAHEHNSPFLTSQST